MLFRLASPKRFQSTMISVLLPLVLCCLAAAAQTESVLHSFTGTDGDGGLPWAGLTRDAKGALYGTTQYGGTSNAGTIFQLTPPAVAGGAWTETVLHSFNGAGEGAYPIGKLILDKHGVIYGTTQQGGIEACFGRPFDGCGTVFRLNPPSSTGEAWTYRTIYKFQGGSIDGAYPLGGVIFDSQGALYGSTHLGPGGSYSTGIIYKLSPPTSGSGSWIENILYQFQAGSDGADPAGNLAMDVSGNLFGTSQGGAQAMTALFSSSHLRKLPEVPGRSACSTGLLARRVDLGQTVTSYSAMEASCLERRP